MYAVTSSCVHDVFVPTNDTICRDILRELDEPMTLFGERQMERRNRLRNIMLSRPDYYVFDNITQKYRSEYDDDDDDEEEENKVDYPFYPEGTKPLLETRKSIAISSIHKASKRLYNERKSREGNCFSALRNDALMNWNLRVREIADVRPLSGCAFSNNGEFIGASSFTGVTKIWSIDDDMNLRLISVLKEHSHHTTDISFQHSITNNSRAATSSIDKTAKLWDTEKGTLLTTFKGHSSRLTRLAFHPYGNFLGTASFDETWRLWDVETSTEFLLQQGHHKSRVYGIAFHPDGSLVASTGLDDKLAKICDLRTGKNILNMIGHDKSIFGVDFSPNGYHLATSSDDNSCRIWDLRKKHTLHQIAAHSKLVSQVRFEPQQGRYLTTASHDKTMRVWSSQDFRLMKTLTGHDSAVSSLDISADGECIASVSHDRTINLWSSCALSSRLIQEEKELMFNKGL